MTTVKFSPGLKQMNFRVFTNTNFFTKLGTGSHKTLVVTPLSFLEGNSVDDDIHGPLDQV